MKSQKIIPFPGQHAAAAKNLLKQPQKPKFDPQNKAAKALANARYRCNNSTSPDYPNYGGKGIKVLLNTSDLIADIGLPGSKDTLDRIDPNGHYEVGNVRWASPAVQAANKKLSKAAKPYSLDHLVERARRSPAKKKDRADTTQAFCDAVAIYNRGWLRGSELDRLLAAKLTNGVLEATSDRGSPRERLGEPGIFHLPSLTVPRARVRMRGDFWDLPENADRQTEVGVLASGGAPPANWNMPERWVQIFQENLRSDTDFGAVWVGQQSSQKLRGGCVEGWMMALAQRLSRTGRSAAFFPALTAVELAHSFGSRRSWDSWSHPLLHVQILFIPDFQLDCGDWGELTSGDWWVLHDLLEWRVVHRLRTFIAVQAPNKLPAHVQRVVLGKLAARTLPEAIPAHPSPYEFPLVEDLERGLDGERYPGLDLTPLHKRPEWRHLVVPSGFVGE